MSMGLTKRQSEALAFIRGFIEAKGYSPNYDEIAAGIGLNSKSPVFAIVARLAERGAITHMPRQARSIALPKVAA